MSTMRIAAYAVTFGGIALIAVAAYLRHLYWLKLDKREAAADAVQRTATQSAGSRVKAGP